MDGMPFGWILFFTARGAVLFLKRTQELISACNHGIANHRNSILKRGEVSNDQGGYACVLLEIIIWVVPALHHSELEDVFKSWCKIPSENGPLGFREDVVVPNSKAML